MYEIFSGSKTIKREGIIELEKNNNIGENRWQNESDGR